MSLAVARPPEQQQQQHPASLLLGTLFEGQSGVEEHRTFGREGDDTPSKNLRREANRLRDFVPVKNGVCDPKRIQRFLDGCEKAKLGAFFGVALSSQASLKTRKGNAAHCQTLTTLFADADFKHLGEEETRRRIDACPLPPSMVVESGGGLHPYFLLVQPFYLKKEMHAAKRWLRHIAASVADVVDESVSEPTRVLRLPGSYNFKAEYGEPRLVTLSVYEPERVYSLDQIREAWGEPDTRAESTRTAGPYAVPDAISKGDRHETNYKFLRSQKARNVPFDVALAGCHALNARCEPPIEKNELDSYLRRVWDQPNAPEFDPTTDPYSLSDTGNSKYFAKLNAARLRYDHREKIWVLFGEHHWSEDTTGEVDRLALETIHKRQHAAIGNEAASKWAVKSLSRSARDNLLRLARSENPLAVAGDGWDQNPWLLGVRGGVVDLQTGVFRDGCADDFITKVAPVAFNAGEDCPRWLQFLTEIFSDNPELVTYMKRVAGYILTGITVELCFFVLHGVGANGKTTFIETLRHVLGHDLCWSMPFPSASWSDNISEYQRAELVVYRTRFLGHTFTLRGMA